MKKLARKKKNSNVLSIADNPRFEPKETAMLCVPNNNKYDYTVYILSESCFGYPTGTYLVCREKFDVSEINTQTMVLVQNGQGSIVAAGITENVWAIVDYIQLDLRRAK